MKNLVGIRRRSNEQFDELGARSTAQLNDLLQSIEVTALVAREEAARVLMEVSKPSRLADIDWMTTMIELHRRRLESVASKYFSGNPEMQAELIQDSTVAAIRYVSEHGREAIEEEKIPQWLATIVRNKCFDIFKERKNRKIVSLHQVGKDGSSVIMEIADTPGFEHDDFVLPEELHKKFFEAFYKYLEGLDLGEGFRQLFGRAPRRGRLWFVLLLGGFSMERIAKEFDVTLNAINVAIYQFRSWMKENAKEYLKEDELAGLISHNRGNNWGKSRSKK